MQGGDIISIGHLARRTGLAVSAIRYYEVQGLVRPTRSPAGQRRFRRSDIRRLSFVQIAQQFGFSIAQIRDQLATLPDARTPTKADWTRISTSFRTELDGRIATLTRLRDKLDGCIGCGCLSLKTCRLYNPDDRAARLGSGARYVVAERPENLDG